jgi:hypothetical protein
MSNPVESIHAVNVVAKTQPTAPPAKNQQTATPTATPQDKVTISPSGQQALASNTKPPAGGDVDHDGDRK